MLPRSNENRMFGLHWVVIIAASMVFSSVGANSDEIVYRLRKPSANRQHRATTGYQYVSHSEESDFKTLEHFLVDLFQTNATKLNPYARDNLNFAMNSFLLEKLNEIYNVDKGGTSPVNPVIEIKTVTEKTRATVLEKGNGNGRRHLLQDGAQGIEALLKVKVMFDSEPAPSVADVEGQVMDIMYSTKNMKEFIDILQSIDGLNWQHENVTMARRRELPTNPPTQSPVNVDFAVTPDDPINSEEGATSAFSMTYTLVAAGSLVAIAALLIFRRKRQSSVMSPKGDMLYMDVAGDLYSMDPSLESDPNYHSPHSMSNSPSMESSTQPSLPNGDSSVSSRATSTNGGDSVFSGLESPRTASNIRASKSLLSGFTTTSATTVQVSNANRLLTNPKKIEQPMPSYLLPGFAEEGEETDDDTDGPHRDRPPRLTATEDSEDSHRDNPATSPSDTSSNLAGAAIDHPPASSDYNMLDRCKGWYGADEVTPKDVLADLADFAQNGNGHSPRDPTPKGAVLQTPGREEPSPRVDHSMVSYGSIMGCSPVNMMCNPKEHDGKQDPAGSRDPNLSSVKVTKMPASPIANSVIDGSGRRPLQTPTPRRSKSVGNMNSGGVISVDSRMTTPLQHNYGKTSVQKLAAATASANSKASTGSRVIKLEWGNGVEAPGTVGAMSAKATKIIGGVYGVDGSVQTHSNKANPVSPGGTRGLDVANLYGAAKGDGNYAENLSRPTTPVEENSVEVTDYAAQYCMSPYTGMFGGRKQQLKPTGSDDSGSPSKDAQKRRHAGNQSIQDGSAMYQAQAMHPLDWSYKSVDTNSVNDSTISEDEGGLPKVLVDKRSRLLEPKSPHSHASTLSESNTRGSTNGSSNGGQLIKDLVWLEKKIANKNKDPYSTALTRGNEPPGIEAVDSLSYKSIDNDGFASPSSQEDSGEEPSILTGKNDSVMSSIVCRDVYAPPGKLHIVIHSTKDGPAVHTVKEGSSLEGHLFSGDLIISVDNVDTRAYTAEQVMKMMASRSTFERKITVLHFEEEE